MDSSAVRACDERVTLVHDDICVVRWFRRAVRRHLTFRRSSALLILRSNTILIACCCCTFRSLLYGRRLLIAGPLRGCLLILLLNGNLLVLITLRRLIFSRGRLDRCMCFACRRRRSSLRPGSLLHSHRRSWHLEASWPRHRDSYGLRALLRQRRRPLL